MRTRINYVHCNIDAPPATVVVYPSQYVLFMLGRKFSPIAPAPLRSSQRRLPNMDVVDRMAWRERQTEK